MHARVTRTRKRKTAGLIFYSLVVEVVAVVRVFSAAFMLKKYARHFRFSSWLLRGKERSICESRELNSYYSACYCAICLTAHLIWLTSVCWRRTFKMYVCMYICDLAFWGSHHSCFKLLHIRAMHQFVLRRLEHGWASVMKVGFTRCRRISRGSVKCGVPSHFTRRILLVS